MTPLRGKLGWLAAARRSDRPLGPLRLLRAASPASPRRLRRRTRQQGRHFLRSARPRSLGRKSPSLRDVGCVHPPRPRSRSRSAHRHQGRAASRRRTHRARHRPRRPSRRCASGATPRHRTNSRRRSRADRAQRTNFSRSSVTFERETCSAETVIPAITNTSSPPSIAAGTSSSARCGVTAPQATAPCVDIARTRSVTNSARTGCAYASWTRRVASDGCAWAMFSNTGSGSS